MASEDNFLRLDPYNFDTEEEYKEFYYNDERIENEFINKTRRFETKS